MSQKNNVHLATTTFLILHFVDNKNWNMWKKNLPETHSLQAPARDV